MQRKKILITGINGFIGSSAAKYFSEKFEIYGLDLFGVGTNNFVLGEVNIDNLKIFNVKFDYILHFAGSGTVSIAQKNPEAEYVKSVLSVKHLLNFCVANNPDAKIIFSSSAAVYGDKYVKPIKEDFSLNPISVYGQHKVESETLLKQYYEQYGVKSNIVRFFSIYGEGLKKQLLWDFSNRLAERKSDVLRCFGSGQEKRDFVHIDDVISFIEILLKQEIDFGIYNCGTGREVSIDTILNLLCEAYHADIIKEYDVVAREGDPKYLCANIDSAVKLGFAPKIKIEEGIAKYAKWFKNSN